MKRMVTDPKTGERTAMVTDSKGGAIWTLTAEEEADKKRAIQKSALKNAELQRFRRAVR